MVVVSSHAMTSMFRFPSLTRRQQEVLWLIALASLITSYGATIMVLALPQIQDGLSIEDAAVSNVAATIRLGSVLAIPIVLAADRVGRRPALLFTIAANAVLTAATGLSPSIEVFVVLQFLARMLHTATGILAAVFIAEEFPMEHRGWGFGALALLSGVGGGLALFMFGVIESLPFGWRSLYLLGIIALFIVPLLRRNLLETERFQQAKAQMDGSSLMAHLRPIASTVMAYPGRFAAIATIVFIGAFSNAAGGLFGPTYLQEEHGWSPSQLSTALVIVGAIAITGALYLGSVSDQHGRKRMAVVFLLLSPAFLISFYTLSGAFLPVLLVGIALMGRGADISMEAMGKELFPTSYRSTVAGVGAMIAAIGGVLGLWAHGRLFELMGDQWAAVSVLATLGFLVPFIVLFTLPETNRRSLEDIAPER